MPAWTERLRAIADDDVRGATDLALDAADALIEALDAGRGDEVLAALDGLKPLMAPIRNLVREVRAAPDAREARARALAIRSSLVSAPAEAARLACDWLRGLRDQPFRAVTISSSVAVELAILEMQRSGMLRGVLVGESRPAGEGRMLARRLRAEVPDVRVAWDAALPGLLRPDCVVVFGADAVTEGAVYNKVGSLMLAVAATASDLPVFAITTSHKVVQPDAMRAFAAAERAVEARAAERSSEGDDPVYDMQFEAVPRDLLTAVITENGPLPGPVRT
jgi:translation initiation factor 2B subunit (eIF-2B alpha/beta/delta family)